MKTAQGVTLIANGRLVDGTGAAPVPDAAVVIKDGKITYAGPAQQRRRSRPMSAASTPAAGRSCRAWSRPISIPPISTWPSWPISTSSTRSNT